MATKETTSDLLRQIGGTEGDLEGELHSLRSLSAVERRERVLGKGKGLVALATLSDDAPMWLLSTPPVSLPARLVIS